MDRIKWWSSNYNVSEKYYFLKYRLLHPSIKGHSSFVHSLNTGVHRFDRSKSNFSMLFLGDIMPINGKQLIVDERLRALIDNADLIVLNLEGIIKEKGRFLALNHHRSILTTIRNVFPKKVIINVGNNHAADFGKASFENHLNILTDNGFEYFGTKEQPSYLINGIHLFSSTFWSNQKANFVTQFGFDDIQPLLNKSISNHYNLFMPHWGYEMQLYPDEQQIVFGNKLLKQWDSIIGNHTHCSQPISVINENQLIAFSLGNFCYNNVNPNHWYGNVLRLAFNCEIGTKPIITDVTNFHTLEKVGAKSISIRSVSDLDYRRIRNSIRYNRKYMADLLK